MYHSAIHWPIVTVTPLKACPPKAFTQQRQHANSPSIVPYNASYIAAFCCSLIGIEACQPKQMCQHLPSLILSQSTMISTRNEGALSSGPYSVSCQMCFSPLSLSQHGEDSRFACFATAADLHAANAVQPDGAQETWAWLQQSWLLAIHIKGTLSVCIFVRWLVCIVATAFQS